ncbi:DeoR/GlpR family DNA-binding transcription regulator [Arthrobacter psychrolactophilus]
MAASVGEGAREHEILMSLAAAGRVMIKDLATRFGVSEVTVRKALDALARRSLVRRIRGGAVALDSVDEGAFNLRLRLERETKLSLAIAASKLVHDGDTLAIDSSTSCYFLAQQILDRRNLVVVTNGMRTATLFMEHSNAMVLMPGGALRRSSGSMVGQFADVLQGRGRIDKGFFGVKSLSIELGLLELSSEEAEAKRYLAAACENTYALFSSTKIGQLGLHSFALAASVTALYTDTNVEAGFLDAWKSLGVEVNTIAPLGNRRHATVEVEQQ